jgi:hypothetical protein
VGLPVLSVVMFAWPTIAADGPKVLHVLAVKVKGDPAAYVQRVQQLEAIRQRLATGGTLRVWRATVAGSDVGTLYVGIEYANLEAYAQANTKLQADQEWTKTMRDLDASGLREVLSNSLLVEVTPDTRAREGSATPNSP